MILNDCYHHYYVTEDWSPEFYLALAREGFISVAQDDYLVPEIQTFYCILDFPDMHVPKKCRKMTRKYTAPGSSLALRFYVDTNPSLCIGNIQRYWNDQNWLSDRYMECLQGITSGLQVHTFELYIEVQEKDSTQGTQVQCTSSSGDTVMHTIKASQTLVAGEVGYTIGSVYTSLTG